MHHTKNKCFPITISISNIPHTTVRNAALCSNYTEHFSCTQAENGNVIIRIFSGLQWARL